MSLKQLLSKHLRQHNPTLFIECLATEIVEAYKYLAGIIEEQEKQCLQKWPQNSDFLTFFDNKYFKTVSEDYNNFLPE